MHIIHNLSTRHDLLAIPGSLIAGIVTYFVLSLFYIPFRITIPETILVSILVFGLTRYYTAPDIRELEVKHDADNISYRLGGKGTGSGIDGRNRIPVAEFIFVSIYVALLIIVIFIPSSDLKIFIPWKDLSLISIIRLGAALALCFFFPGYAIISVVDKAHKLRPLLRGLLAYILSMFLSGFTGYVLASFGYPLLGMGSIFIGIYGLALLSFIVVLFSRLAMVRNKIVYGPFSRTVGNQIAGFFRKMRLHTSVLLIFGSLFVQVILSTYSLYGGIIVGDQWFHHGRSLTVIYGSYNNFAASGMEQVYPPFLSTLLAAFFTLSGNTPSVNAYASIAFLNIVPVLGFYYFFTSWISGPRLRKTAMLASVLFLLSAGFGWIYAVDNSSSHPATSPISALQTLFTASKQTFDIRTPSTYVLASHPDFSTGIQLIVLPIGFVLLGLIQEVTKNRKIKFCAIVFVITTLAILSHDEIYFFIIIASILPLVFRMSDKQFIYVGLFCSILFTFVLDMVFPGRYSRNEFFGLPLQVLCLLFVSLMWFLYGIKNKFKTFPVIKIPSLPKKDFTARLMFGLGIALAVGAAFLYIFTYIVWGHLSIQEIQLHISTSNVPWYLYPMKLGLMGVLGLAFIISYVFRKFEKEVFVFGIISLIALLLGPYYDEHRFSKYVMIGMIGFASLLVYELVLFINRSHFNHLFTGILIGSIIVVSSFSTLFFIGYHALALETNRLDLALGRRDFPPLSQMPMFSFLQRDNKPNNTEYSNVLIFANEYQTQHGLLGKLQGFSGLPIPMLLKEPLTLNASTLEGLYSHLASSNSRYILLPNSYIHGNRSDGEKFSNILEFIYNHFQKAYEDDSFIILSVPAKITPPSSKADVALLYERNGFLSSPAILDKRINLPFNSISFENINDSEFVKFEKNKDNIILYGDNKSHSLWSNQLEQKNRTQAINYIEDTFRIIGNNKTKTHNDCGLTWDNGKKRYYINLRDDKIGFAETPAPENKFVLENKELKWQKWIWYTLKIVFENGGASVYVDDSLKLQIPESIFENDNPISRVGIRCSGGNAEFEPIKLGSNSRISNNSFQEKYDIFHHFYPLSILALSNIPYDTFLENDNSIYSKKYVLLSHDPSDQEDINKYLEVVRRGGTLIVMNTNDSTAEGGFSKLLTLKQGNSTHFDSVALARYDNRSEPNRLQISGSAREIDVESKSNVSIVSYYLRNNQPIIPFAIEKKYGNTGGRIVFVNIAGYFDALYKSPKKYFSTLGNISELLNIDTGNSYERQRSQGIVSEPRFVGNLTASGHAVINSSSLLFPNNNSNNTYAEKISISNEDEKRYLYGRPEANVTYKGIPIKDIKLYGPYTAIIASDGVIRIPSPYSPSSEFDYVAISIPTGSDITFKLSNGARMEFKSGNQTRQYNFSDDDEVRFNNIKTDNAEVDSVLVLLKKPEFTLSGNISFGAIYRSLVDFYLTKDVFGVPMNLSHTKIKATIDDVSNYEIVGKNRKTINYLTYLKTFNLDEKSPEIIDLKIPGDISFNAREQGMEVPWEKIIISYSSIATFSILSVGALLTFLLWKRLSARSDTA